LPAAAVPAKGRLLVDAERAGGVLGAGTRIALATSGVGTPSMRNRRDIMSEQNQSQKPNQQPGEGRQKQDQRMPQPGQDLPGQAQPGQRQPGQEQQDERPDDQNPGGRRARAEDEPGQRDERGESDDTGSQRR
jgi:hypothetical protein